MEDRIQALEQSVRQLRLACVALIVSLAAVVLIAAGVKQAPGPIVATELRIVDGAGKERVRVGPGEGGGSPGIRIFDADGTRRAGLLPGSVVLFDHKGKTTAFLNWQSLCLISSGTDASVSLTQHGDTALLVFRDHLGHAPVSLGAMGSGPSFELRHAKGAPGIWAFAQSDMATLVVGEQDGEQAVMLSDPSGRSVHIRDGDRVLKSLR